MELLSRPLTEQDSGDRFVSVLFGLFFKTGFSLCISDCSGTSSVDQAGLELKDCRDKPAHLRAGLSWANVY